ncbi:MAG: type II toxin-antitoxin system RelE/ParE family toxin [Dehalococcoidales bacterium]|nr:type II toxin-antitoxin system RelE/ParE family toxin [Dehalococcoidales bacterium]
MYDIKTTPFAERNIEKLKKRTSIEDFERIRSAIRNLAQEPQPQGAIKLKKRENTYRIRIGKFRIIYQIRDKEMLVLVVKVARRTESTYDF